MRFWPASNNLRNKALCLLTTETLLVKLDITSKSQLCFSSRPRKAAKPDKRYHGWHQHQLQWLMTTCSSTDQLVDTTTLRRHTWKADKYLIEILSWHLHIKDLKKNPAQGLSLEHPLAFHHRLLSPGFILFLSLSLSMPVPFPLSFPQVHCLYLSFS